jgi:hypothetical protein
VLDLATGRIIATFENVAPNASLYATESGRVVAAIQGGLHFVSHHGYTTVHFDGRYDAANPDNHFGAASSAYTGLVRIDPTDTEVRLEHVLDLNSVYCDFELEREAGETVVALARDGRVHTLDVATWSGHKTSQLFAPSTTTCAGRLIAGDGVAYVTDTAQAASSRSICARYRSRASSTSAAGPAISLSFDAR